MLRPLYHLEDQSPDRIIVVSSEPVHNFLALIYKLIHGRGMGIISTSRIPEGHH